MPSPFPGMDPYLERRDYWRAVHTRFLVCLQDILSPLLEPRYFVDLEESVTIDRAGDPDGGLIVADVSVAAEPGPQTGAPGAAVAAPLTATIPVPKPARRTRRWLSVRDSKDRAVTTVIEVLSPSDKRPGKDRDRYLAKRARVLRSSAHLIEIDLLRGGHRMPVDGLPACDYCVVVSRRPERPRAGVWPFTVRDPLPAIPIPLAAGEAEPVVALRPVLDRVYDGGGYGRKVYDAPPDPPLSADDAGWAGGFVPAG